MIAPNTPVNSTRPAAMVGSPPSRSAMPIATGAVVDFGAMLAIITCGRPNARAISRTDTTAVTDPASNAAISGSAACRTRRRLS